MSNERSPREVCSITIGIKGLISGWLLAAGGPQFRLLGWVFLVWRPDRVACGSLLGRDALDFVDDAVESAGQPHVLALGVVRAGGASLLDDLVGFLEAVAEGLVDFFLRDLDSQLIRSGLEHELAGDRGSGLFLQARDEVLGRVAGHLEISVERAAAALQDGVELTQESAGAGVDERPGDLNVRRLNEPVEGHAPESLVHLGLDLVMDALLDVRP